MPFRWPSFASLSIAAASGVLFAAAGHFAADALLDAQRARLLRDLADVAMRRAEIAVDFGVETLNELARRGPASCDPAALQAVRLTVYQRGAVKDIRVLDRDGSVVCSAYSETLEFDSRWPGRDEMLPTGDATLRIFRVDQFFGVALGLLQDLNDKTSLAAILGISEALYDIMPTALRDHSEVALVLGRDQTIVRAPEPFRLSDSADIVSFSASSARYPLRTVVRVEQGTLAGWDNEPYLPIVAMATLIGLAFGVLFGPVVTRPAGPEVEFDKALAAQEFRPYLQPIFDLRTGAIVGCEALARWVRPTGSPRATPGVVRHLSPAMEL